MRSEGVSFIVKSMIFVVVVAVVGVAWYLLRGKQPDHGNESHQEHAGHKDDGDHSEEGEKSTGGAAQLAEVQPAEINIYVKAPGTIEFHPQKALRLHPSFPGVVTRVHKDLGDQVRPGDALATIDSTVGFQTFTLSSPIAGTILSKNVSNGQTVTPEEELFAVGDTSVLRARLAVAARDIRKLKKDQELLLVSENLDRISTKISFVSPILSEDTRTATAIADFSFEKFRPGMFVTGAVKEGVKKVDKSIPVALCNPLSNKSTVTVSASADPGTETEQRVITTGASDYERCEVKSGLDTGEKVLIVHASGNQAKESHSSDE